MNIGILGSGNVGGTLGKGWAAAGHQVVFGSRQPESEAMRARVAQAGNSARSASLAQAAAQEVVLLATPWQATRAVLESLDLGGRILIDATNPLLPDLSGLEYGTTTSGAEQVASWAPGARVVKAFNSIGYNIMANPRFSQDQAVLFYCGDDAEARAVTGQLAEELGFQAVDCGPLTRARLLEPFAHLWISLAFGGHGREIGFKFLKR